MKGSDNPYPSILVAEGSAPAAPAAGKLRLFIDSSDHLLKTINSAGTVAAVDSVDPEFVRDTIAAALVAGTGVTFTIDDPGDTITVDATGDPEFIRDTIGAALTAGVGVTVTVDDAGNTITLSSTAIPNSTARTAAYTLALADAGQVVPVTVGSGVNITIPANATVAFPIGTVIEVEQYGAGQLTMVPDTGVTLRSPGGTKSRVQYSSVRLRKRATDEWVASGDTTT